MKYHLIPWNRIMLLCFGLGIYYPAFSSIIITDIIETEEVCDLSNGTLTIIAQGGAASLRYSIDGGSIYQSSNYFDGLDSKEYLVIVSDGSTSSEARSAQITRSTAPLQPIKVTCPEYIDIGCLDIDALSYQVLDSITIEAAKAYEVDYEYSLDLHSVDCDFVYTFDAEVRIYDACNQEAACKIRVNVEPQPIVFIPNTFSPGIRNVQKLTVYGNPVIEEVEVFHVYNRWGRIVHEAKKFQAGDESKGWNGTINNESDDMEVYTYYVVCRSITGKVLEYAGNVTLLK